MKKLLAWIMFAVMTATLFAPGACPVQAAGNVKANVSYKKAPSIKKGERTVTIKKQKKESYVVFKASKKGKYVFTFSALQGNTQKTRDTANLLVTSCSEKKNSKGKKVLFYKLGKSSGKKLNHFYLTTQKQYASGKLAKRFTASRTVTYSMKKGEKLYLEFYGVPGNISLKINVKKK